MQLLLHVQGITYAFLNIQQMDIGGRYPYV